MSEPTEMELVVGSDGGVKCIYGEELDLRELGKLQITRASHVEPDAEGYWWADMGPSDGPVLGPFKNRTEALAAERKWLASVSARRTETQDVRHLVGTPPTTRMPPTRSPFHFVQQKDHC
jgi:hypothetical protein